MTSNVIMSERLYDQTIEPIREIYNEYFSGSSKLFADKTEQPVDNSFRSEQPAVNNIFVLLRELRER